MPLAASTGAGVSKEKSKRTPLHTTKVGEHANYTGGPLLLRIHPKRSLPSPTRRLSLLKDKRLA
jgi:hypothetical protein